MQIEEQQKATPHAFSFFAPSTATGKWALAADDGDDWEVVDTKKKPKAKETPPASSSGGRHGGGPAASHHRHDSGPAASYRRRDSGPAAHRDHFRDDFTGGRERYTSMEHMKGEIIDIDLEEYARRPLQRRDEKGNPIDTPEDMVWAYNHYVLKQARIKPRAKTLKTDLRANPGRDRAAPHDFPSGLAVLAPLDTDLGDKALMELHTLFQHNAPNFNPSTTSQDGPDIAYLVKRGKDARPPYMPITEALHDILNKRRLHNLHDFIVLHLKAILASTGAHPDIVHRIGLNVIRYQPNHGILAHIDNISDFGGQFGPIFTVAMGAGLKYLDLLPVLTPESAGKLPVRLITEQYQTVLMQGEARSDYAHAVPHGNPNVQYTLAFKLPHVDGGTPGPTYYSDLFGPVQTVLMR
jgi:hypothetical protein